MLSDEMLIERIHEVNPVPNIGDVGFSADALLSTINERSGLMQTGYIDKTPTKQPDHKRKTGWLVAAASFAVVLVIGLVTAVLLSQSSDSEPAEPQVTTTTVAPNTDASGKSPAEQFDSYWDSIANGASEDALSVLTLGVYEDGGFAPAERGIAEFLTALGFTYSVGEPCGRETLGPGTFQRECSLSVQSAVHEKLEAEGDRAGIIFADNTVAIEARILLDDNVQFAYATWANENDAEAFRAVCDPGLYDYEFGLPYGDRFIFTRECGAYLASITNQVADDLATGS